MLTMLTPPVSICQHINYKKWVIFNPKLETNINSIVGKLQSSKSFILQKKGNYK